jgi:hypothetical protein
VEKRRKPWVLVLIAAIPTVVGFALFTLSPFGIHSGFPPSLWVANRLNRMAFASRERGYREMAARIRQEHVGFTLKEGERAYFELGAGREVPTLKRLPGDTPSEKLDELYDDVRLVEVQGFRGGGLAIRFLIRHVWGAGTYSLICWDPKPADDCVWWATDWWENQHIDWIDGQWWSVYSERSSNGHWSPRRVYGLHGD